MTLDPARIEIINRAAKGRTICPDCTKLFLELLDVAGALNLPAPRGPDEDHDADVSGESP